MKKDPSIAIVLAWLFPGLGHLYLGRRHKAAFFCAVLTLTFLAGYALADFRFVRFDDNPFYYVGRWGAGVIWLATGFMNNAPPRGTTPLEYYEPGLLYMCSAGLLNMVLVLSLVGTGAREKGKPAASSPGSAAPHEPFAAADRTREQKAGG